MSFTHPLFPSKLEVMPNEKVSSVSNAKCCKPSGFTLIELLIVISIIAILVAAGIYSWQAAQLKGRDNRRKTDIKAVQQAMENYFQVNGKYPSDTGGVVTCNLSGDSSIHGWGTAFTCGGNTYIQKLPTDPTQQSTLGYYYSNPTFATYIISANMENTKDPDTNPATMGCTPQGGRNYCVKNP